MKTVQDEIIPLEIRGLRHGIGLTQKLFGTLLIERLHQPSRQPPPSTRINEWENHIRSCPEYVYTACAQLLIELWARSRWKVSGERRARIDLKFATLLNPALAQIIDLEYTLAADPAGTAYLPKVRQARRELETYLGKLLRIDVSAVFDERDNPSSPTNDRP